jgi:hypothetical protein
VKKTKDDSGGAIEIKPVESGGVTLNILGTTPLIMNRQSEKAKRQLLLPAFKNRGERATTLKHDPMAEFVDSAYRYRVDTKPTRCYMPSTSFKRAMMTAALDMPGGATKAGVGRHVSVLGETIPIFGIPRLRADMVRQAGMTKTPDTRFRCEFVEWACRVDIRFALLGLTETSVANLVLAAGFICGVGDFRQEKGAGTYGQFVITSEGLSGWDEWQRIVATGGREAQDAAFADPDMNDEGMELVEWFNTEIQKRGRQRDVEDASGGKRKRGGNGSEVPANG